MKEIKPGALIGGTGIYSVTGIETESFNLENRWGTAKVYRAKGEYDWLHFIPRHGENHSVPPHRINYRANIEALVDLGIERVIALFAVGSISQWIKPGEFGLPDQFIDMTWGREHTFFDGGDSGLHHTSMNQPYCPVLQDALDQSGRHAGVDLARGGTYLCVNGPRFETPAEIRMYRQWGADVSGMTGATEAALAGERELHYAALAWSMNWCAGIEEDLNIISREAMLENKATMMQIAIDALKSDEGRCSCRNRIIA